MSQLLFRIEAMGPISITAEAGLDIIRRLAAGELEVHGILLRDTAGKKFRYILRGLENLPGDPVSIVNLPPLEPLRSALNATQLLQVVAVAQNAAMAASLRRIEASLTRISRQLDGIEIRLTRIDTRQQLLLEAVRSGAATRLISAKTAAVVAYQAGDRTALISAGQNAEHASREILAQAKQLVRVQEDGLPFALLAPTEFADIAEAAADAARIASAIWIALDAREPARLLMAETADSFEIMRRQMATALQDPELAIRRATAKIGADNDIEAAGKRLQIAMHSARGREIFITSGALSVDVRHTDFETLAPSLPGLSFHSLLT